MADDHADDEAARAAIRERYRAERARIAAIPAEEWAEQRDAEVRTVRE